MQALPLTSQYDDQRSDLLNEACGHNGQNPLRWSIFMSVRTNLPNRGVKVLWFLLIGPYSVGNKGGYCYDQLRSFCYDWL